MNRMLRTRTPINNNNQDLLSPEKRKLIQDASLDTLKKLYEKCYAERLPRSALINAIEEEIFRKTYNEKTMKIDRIYKLKEFVSNKK